MNIGALPAIGFAVAAAVTSAASAGQIASPAPAWQDGAAPQPRLPFRQIDAIRQDEGRALYLFSFRCPFCREHDERIRGWGRGLPASIGFDAYPVITDVSDAVLARAYFAVELLDRALLADAVRLLFALGVRGESYTADGGPGQLWPTMQHLGISKAEFARTWRDPRVKRRLEETAAKMAGYPLAVTPSLAIAGRFLVSAALTNGDYDALLAVASGLVSMMLEGEAGAGFGI